MYESRNRSCFEAIQTTCANILPAIFCYAWEDGIGGNVCMYDVVLFLIQLGSLRIQNLYRTLVETLCLPSCCSK
jgi:hypothetical protein